MRDEKLATLISTALFVLPGFLIFIFITLIGQKKEIGVSDLERTLMGLVLNIPLLIMSVTIIYWYHYWKTNEKILNFIEIKSFFYDPVFVVKFIALEFLLCIIIAFAWVLLFSKIFYYLINVIRDCRKLPSLSEGAPYGSFFSSVPDPIIEIVSLSDEKKVRGFLTGVGDFMSPKQVITFIENDQLKWIDELKEFKPKKSLVIFSDKIILNLYSTKEFIKAVKKEFP